MKKRRLGRSSIQVAPLMLGGNVFGWTIDEPQSFKVLDAFVAAGFDFIDTADVYSRWAPPNKGGESETILGNWMKQRGNRDKIILATKVGNDMGDGKKGLSSSYIAQAVEDSLKRLQTDYIDLYQSHQDDPQTPIEETLGAYAQLIQQGKVRVIGASNFTAPRLKESLEVSRQRNYPRYESLQPHYNLYDRADYETNLEPVCVQNEIGVIPYLALASGFLTGKYRSEKDLNASPRARIVKKYLDARGLRILAALDEVAKEKNAAPAEIAVAWLIARPSITAPIASATSEQQLSSLIRATEIDLDPKSIEKLNQASAY
ncbi:MAG TPA: aldo/keto reductase [Acidobacteriaceae bacterium]|jgi:aryl-alcohol dehydrogenase-like predicted oxidoreductase